MSAIMSWKMLSVILLMLLVEQYYCQPSLPAISDTNQDDRPSAPVILGVDVDEYEYSEPYDETFNPDKELTNMTLEDLDNEHEHIKNIPVSVKISYLVTPGKSEEDEDVTNASVEGTGPVLTWWQIVLIAVACLLVTASCCYLSRCCFLVADCCSDPFWGCCPCCSCCVARRKYHTRIRKGTSSAYDLNESRTVVSTSKRSGLSTDSGGHRRTSRSASRDPVTELSVNTTMQSPSKSGEVNNATVTTIISGVDNNATITNNNSIEKNATVTRNYKRRPASDVTKEKSEGINESQPHVYEDDSSYFSILHLLGRSKRRYHVSPQKRQGYRRYHHIAESRNSAVIPTKISKRSSTASTYMTRPIVNQRSKSVESFSSNEPDCDDRLLEETDTNLNRSERSLPGRPHSRSRLSANLADLESRSERCLSSKNRIHGSQGRMTPVNCPTVPLIDKQTLKYFEKSLLGSKETTL